VHPVIMPGVKTPHAFEHATSAQDGSTSGSMGSPKKRAHTQVAMPSSASTVRHSASCIGEEGGSVLTIEGDLHEMTDALDWPPRVVLCEGNLRVQPVCHVFSLSGLL
jgi:hypothetical protein